MQGFLMSEIKTKEVLHAETSYLLYKSYSGIVFILNKNYSDAEKIQSLKELEKKIRSDIKKIYFATPPPQITQ